MQQHFVFLNKKRMRKEQGLKLLQNYNRHQKGQSFFYQDIIWQQQCVEQCVLCGTAQSKKWRTLQCRCHKWHENRIIQCAVLSPWEWSSNARRYIYPPFKESILFCAIRFYLLIIRQIVLSKNSEREILCIKVTHAIW